MAEFLVRHGGERFCAECLARPVAIRNLAHVRRTIRYLSADLGYRIEDNAECSRCNHVKRTIRALWVGL